MFKNKNGFTFVEILAVIAVLGTIAVLTLPNFLLKSKEEAFIRSKEAENMRLTEAIGQMNLNKQFSISDTNEIFVNKFSEYIKIAKRCDSTNLDGCFASTFKTASGEEIELSSLTKGTDLGKTNNTEPLAGFVLVNGSSYVVALKSPTDAANSSCLTGGQLANRTSCVSMLYDINGSAKPNVIGRDIASLNVTITPCDGTKIGALCVDTEDILPTTYGLINTCDGSPNISWDPIGSADLNCEFNAWAGAKKYCYEQKDGMRLPTLDELKVIYNKACGAPSETACVTTTKRTELGFGTMDYWSSTEYGLTNAWGHNFGSGALPWASKNSQLRARCIR